MTVSGGRMGGGFFSSDTSSSSDSDSSSSSSSYWKPSAPPEPSSYSASNTVTSSTVTQESPSFWSTLFETREEPPSYTTTVIETRTYRTVTLKPPSPSRLSTVSETNNSNAIEKKPPRPMSFWEKSLLLACLVAIVAAIACAVAEVRKEVASSPRPPMPVYQVPNAEPDLLLHKVQCAGSSIPIYKIQVCLVGITKTLQNDLNRIAGNADSSTTKGLQYILTEAALALFRYPDSWFSAHSSVYATQSLQGAEKQFNRLSFDERAKFDEVTLLNVNNFKMHGKSNERVNGEDSEYMVVTIFLAAKGAQNIPVIDGSASLKEALQKLGCITSNHILAVEVVWSPQKENDMLTEQELHKEYPLLEPWS